MKINLTAALILLGSIITDSAAAACPLSALQYDRLWSGNLSDWSRVENGAQYQFGKNNIEYDGGQLRAVYPVGSYDPAATRSTGSPLGGAQFKTRFDRMGLTSRNEIGVRYSVTFDQNFQFVRGGKLAGLFGGTANTGGAVPNGVDGFSLRFGWQAFGAGALLAYLPSSGKWGTIFGHDQWRFKPGKPAELAVYVRLNNPKEEDGVLGVWVDDVLIAFASNVLFRTSESLRADGFLLSTFFGGSTPDWATPVTTGVVFGNMELFTISERTLSACAGRIDGIRGRREIN